MLGPGGLARWTAEAEARVREGACGAYDEDEMRKLMGGGMMEESESEGESEEEEDTEEDE